MSAHTDSSSPGAPLDLTAWRNVPFWLMVVGGIGAVIGWIHDPVQFGFSWLQAFMFFLSFGLGGLGLVILHHLFDASWSVPIRRVCEHLACLLPWMALAFIPIWILAPRMYPWMIQFNEHAANPAVELSHAVHSKYPLLTPWGFRLVAIFNFVVWAILTRGFRKWSLRQDETGGVDCTRTMRRYAAVGVFLFAVTLTLAAIMWMKSLFADWFSTMYGVWYFAASMWTTLFTVYVLTYLLKRQGPLREVATDKTFYFIGSLMFAFTVFYAYVTFFQYFIIWNANMPEETFWYVLREKGTWWDIGLIIIFGHFFLPFLTLLRIDVKISWLWVMLPLGMWAWLMHFADIAFQVMPAHHPDGFAPHWMDAACMALLGGFLAWRFLKDLGSHPIVPQKDPRIAEALDIYVEPASAATGAAGKAGGAH